MGIRGIPATHGGFESFAEGLALYLVKQGWDVTVYCQKECQPCIEESEWQGVKLINIGVPQTSAIASFIFDWKSIIHAAKRGGIMLTLGYNTAIFCAWHRINGITNLMNMDGIEWKRQKWPLPIKIWLYINEKLGCWLSNHLIADHPEIKNHLTRNVKAEKITVIPYGADSIEHASIEPLQVLNVESKKYCILIARPEPENSILEMVQAFSAKQRGIKLLVLGKYSLDHHYQNKVLEAASDEVIFAGAIYDSSIVQALRFHALLYFHGHQVGGTNPSLVEAMGAGNAVLAHNNIFNRWVAGDKQFFFSNKEECKAILDKNLTDSDSMSNAAVASRQRYSEHFTQITILKQYESLLSQYIK